MRAARAALGTLAACAALLALAAPASASYQRPFVEVFGSAAEPTFEWPSLVAVDPSTGDLLVGDYYASSISRFKPNGEPDPFPALGTNVIDGKRGPGNHTRAECETAPEPESCDETPQNGIEVSSEGGKNQQIAVSPVSGDIFVTQVGGLGKPELVDIFSGEGAYLGQLTRAGTKKLASPRGVAVDAAGAIYVSQKSEISKYVPSANPPLNTDNVANFKTEGYLAAHLALGSGVSAGQLFVSVLGKNTSYPVATLEVNSETGASHVYVEGFSALGSVDPTSGNPIISIVEGQFGFVGAEAAEFDGGAEVAGAALSRLEEPREMRDLVVNGSGEVYVVIGPSDPRVFVFGPPAVVPTVSLDPATDITTTEATLSGTVNPEGIEASDCRFEVLSATEPRKNEAQKVTIAGATGGDFTLSFEGQTTEPIPYGASRLEVSWALQKLSTVGERNIRVVGGPGGPYYVYFEGALVETDVPQLEADASELTPGGTTIEATTFTQGKGWGNATVLPCEGPIPTDEQAHPVEARLTGLEPNETKYLYRLSASSENGTERSEIKSLKTETTAQTEPATEITRTSATLNGTVRPEGQQFEECFFQWGLASNKASYEHSAECEPEAATIPPGAEEEDVSAPITGLAEATEYRFRLVAVRPGGTQEAKELTFITAGPPSILAVRSSGATQSALTLEAEINPGDLETTYRFEWGPTSSYGNVVSGLIPKGTESVRVTAPISGLSPATTYHYRVLVENEGNAGEPVQSEDQLAETLNSCGLPEGRCMELVSPRELGPVAAPGHNPGKGIYAQPASQGGSFLYQVDTGLPEATKGGAVTYLGTRGPSGWSSTQLNPAITERIETSPYTNPSAIAAASPDLSCSVLISSQLLTEDPAAKIAAEMGAASLYRRAPDGAYTLISELVPEGPNVTSTRISDEYKVIGMSEDCGRVVFETKKQYPGVAGAGEWRLYEWEEGALRNVGSVPKEGGGEEAAEAVAGQSGAGFDDHYNAVSADGRRVFFTAKRKTEKVAGETGTTGVFVRIDGTETLDVSASETPTPDSGATFQGATPDGKRVYFVANAGLTAESNTAGRDLYECEIVDPGSGPECELTDLSVNPESGAAEVGVILGGSVPFGLVGVAADGSRGYFIAQGQLEAGQGPSQAENEAANSYSLYAYQRGSGEFSFIATIAGNEASSIVLGGTTVTARASASGRYLLFESSAQVTAYDSGGLEEAYLYDAQAGSEAARLACVSCRQDGEASVNTGAIGTKPLLGESLAVRGGEALAFFKSRDALAAGAVEGEWSLYEWAHGQVFKIATEKPGVSVPNWIGTLKYIGTNADATDLYFFDSAALNWENPEGRDAAWDARIGGGFAEPAAPPPGCDPGVESSCQGPGSPAPGAPPAAGSASFTGPGNAKPRKHKKHKKAHKKHRRRHHHKKRRGHGKKHKAGKHKNAHQHKRKRSSR